MLGMKSYSRDYVDACRRRVDTQLAAYRDLAAQVATGTDGGEGSGGDPLAAFAPLFFNSMVVVLDACFVHRIRAVEGKNGNPLNEVRVLAKSLLENAGVLAVDKSIKLTPEASVLGLQAGDEVALGEADFAKLSDAFFAEIEKKFV
jgi:hypothetical protein